jgi:hypothetical protein
LSAPSLHATIAPSDETAISAEGRLSSSPAAWAVALTRSPTKSVGTVAVQAPPAALAVVVTSTPRRYTRIVVPAASVVVPATRVEPPKSGAATTGRSLRTVPTMTSARPTRASFTERPAPTSWSHVSSPAVYAPAAVPAGTLASSSMTSMPPGGMFVRPAVNVRTSPAMAGSATAAPPMRALPAT